MRLKIPDQELDEVPEIVKRFEFVSNGTRVSFAVYDSDLQQRDRT